MTYGFTPPAAASPGVSLDPRGALWARTRRQCLHEGFTPDRPRHPLPGGSNADQAGRRGVRAGAALTSQPCGAPTSRSVPRRPLTKPDKRPGGTSGSSRIDPAAYDTGEVVPGSVTDHRRLPGPPYVRHIGQTILFVTGRATHPTFGGPVSRAPTAEPSEPPATHSGGRSLQGLTATRTGCLWPPPGTPNGPRRYPGAVCCPVTRMRRPRPGVVSTGGRLPYPIASAAGSASLPDRRRTRGLVAGIAGTYEHMPSGCVRRVGGRSPQRDDPRRSRRRGSFVGSVLRNAARTCDSPRRLVSDGSPGGCLVPRLTPT